MMTFHSKTVYLKPNQTLTDWVRGELKDKLSNRYKIIHMAEDMNINNITLYRFLHGREVKSSFYDKAFSYLIKN